MLIDEQIKAARNRLGWNQDALCDKIICLAKRFRIGKRAARPYLLNTSAYWKEFLAAHLKFSRSKSNCLTIRQNKEKVISRTIKLSPDYSSIIHEIIDDFSETVAGYKEFLLKEEQHIIQLFTESKSGNLRTLRSLLIDFERVFSCLKKICFDEITASNIFCSFGAMLFEHKAGNYKSGQYGFLTADAELQKKYSLGSYL